MSRKPKQDDPAQSKRFIETAREIEADASQEAFERSFKKVITKTNQRPPPRLKKPA